MPNDNRSVGQKWADTITEWSGSWSFIGWFVGLCVLWIAANSIGITHFDVYPFLAFNLLMTLISTIQSPLILLSQNRQNETDRETVQEMLKRLEALQASIDTLKHKEA